ncbi:hypothetical protein Patl1_34101 [Pistacia atlantica]|uniref:Uncharacterized protein n=1 Tax=Pistacia atlantica TaxID=434234 RepID=A0ACC0ZPG4_9ROSI|nr:hypothetical protein Patl1_34101 [Pistacia atlantica]
MWYNPFIFDRRDFISGTKGEFSGKHMGKIREIVHEEILSRFYLKKQLSNFRIKEGTSMSDHLNDFNQLVTKLLDFGVVIEDEDKALYLLNLLPDKYDHLVDALLYGKKTITCHQVSMALLKHDLWKKLLSLRINSECEGLVVRRSQSTSWKSKSQKNVEIIDFL